MADTRIYKLFATQRTYWDSATRYAYRCQFSEYAGQTSSSDECGIVDFRLKCNQVDAVENMGMIYFNKTILKKRSFAVLLQYKVFCQHQLRFWDNERYSLNFSYCIISSIKYLNFEIIHQLNIVHH